MLAKTSSTSSSSSETIATSSSSTSSSSTYIEDYFTLFDDFFDEVDSNYSAEPVLSDDIWKKFELDATFDDLYHIHLDPVAGLDIFNCDNKNISLDELCKIRHHDCMWAGHCASKEHPISEQNNFHSTFCPQMPTLNITRQRKNTITSTIQPGRSLLLKQTNQQQQQTQQCQKLQQQKQQHQQQSQTTFNNATQQQITSPESPPMSDDEENKPSLLQLLNDAIKECGDNDLCEYFEDDDEIIKDPQDFEEIEKPTIKQQQQQQQPVHAHIPTKEHSYHKDVNATMRITHLGIETPSDSGKSFIIINFIYR